MLARMITAAAFAATLMAGSAMAQVTNETDPQGGAKPQDMTTGSPATGDAHMNADGTQTGDMGGTSSAGATGSMDASGSMGATSGSMGASGGATMSNQTVAMQPIPDTAENRAKYGKPMSNAGKRSKPSGN